MELQSKTGYRLEEIPDAPETLSSGARKHWDEMIPLIVDLKTARYCDIPALVMLCEARADLDALQTAIRSEGITTEAGSGGKKAHPALRSLEVARRQVETMLDRFGLIPGGSPHKAPSYAAHLEHYKRMHADDE